MSKLVLLLMALVALVYTSAAIDACAFAYVNADTIFIGSSVHTTARLIGTGTLIQPSQILPHVNGAQYVCFEGLVDEGEYEFVSSEPGFYQTKTTQTINYENTQVVFYLVPPTTGIVIVPHTLLEGFTAVFWSNLTLPSGTGMVGPGGEALTHVTAMDGEDEYMWGTLPMAVQNNYWRTVVNGAAAGTYRLYIETFHSEYMPGVYEAVYNFSTVGPLTVSIYGGLDLQNGLKAQFVSSTQNAYSWYIGDIVVTKPSQFCSIYNFQEVNTYSTQYGFDQTNHGNGALMLEECFDFTPSQVQCANMQFEDSVSTLTCGAFGDPHIVKFDGVGVTCGTDTTITLVDNEYISITADTRFLNSSNNATAIEAISLTYKNPCNPTSIRFNDLATIESLPFNSPYAFAHRMRISGNNIYVDAIHLRLQVRWDGRAVVFGISMPASLVATSSGICVDSCRPGTHIDEAAVVGAKRDSAEVRMAQDACTDAGLASGSFEYQSCVFDVSSTSDVAFAANAATAVQVQSDVATAWVAAPIAGPESTPTGSTSSLAPLSFLVVALLALSALL